MWPWEHLALGYLLFSLGLRVGGGRAPADWSVAVLAFGTQFPDLVDKPLGWVLGVFDSGTALGHSVFVAVPVCVVVLAIGSRLDARQFAGAFAVGYLSHLPADALYPALLGGRPEPAKLLWPVVSSPAGGSVDVWAHVLDLLATFVTSVGGGAGSFLLLELSLLSGALVLWLVDGRPGVGLVIPRPGVGRAGD